MRTFAIGDIHGHAKELQDLLLLLERKAKYNPEKDNLVLCGDLVDSGPDSKKVLDFCIDYKDKYPDTFYPLRGNHDDMMVDALKYNCVDYGTDWWLRESGYADNTLASYPNKQVPDEHLSFLDNLPYLWENDKYVFVHAGLPNFSLAEIRKGIADKDKELLELLTWIRGDFYNSSFDWGKKVIFGHTPFNKPMTNEFQPYVKENMIGINTMPRNEGYLTAVLLPEEEFYSGK